MIENEIYYLHLNISKGEKKTEKVDGENESRSSYLYLYQSIVGINALQNISKTAEGKKRKTFEILYLLFLISASFSFSLALSFFIVLLIWSSCLDNFSPG